MIENNIKENNKKKSKLVIKYMSETVYHTLLQLNNYW